MTLPTDTSWTPLLEQLPDAVIHTDTRGVVLGWNAAAQALFGHPAQEVLGRSIDLIIPERLRAAHWAGFDRAMAAGVTRHGREALLTRAVTRGGEAIYVEMSFAVVRDEDGTVRGSVSVARDATARQQQQREWRERLAVLEGAVRPE
jgi:PAS domain S-box-containing protein